uniref:Uncharacterized protein n=1 Tax=Arundo donax TaxID=35708 RepID=A0A0A9AFX6_ARUDO
MSAVAKPKLLGGKKGPVKTLS